MALKRTALLRWLARVIGLLFFLAASQPLFSQPQRAEILINQIDILPSGHTRLYLSILGSSHDPVLGLAQDAFQIFEDERPVAVFQAARLEPDEAINLMLVLDTSGSMAQENRIEQLRSAARLFLGTLAANDQCAIIGFDDEIRVLNDFSHDVTALQNSLAALQARNDTRLFDGIIAGIEALARFPLGRKAVIVLSDGLDEGSIFLQDDCIHKAVDARVPVYSITVGDRGKVSRQAVARIALLSGGEYFHADQPEVLADVYLRIANRLKKQYGIAFPTGLPMDGGWHRLRVVLENSEYSGVAVRELQMPAGTKPLEWLDVLLIVIAALISVLLLVGGIVYYLLARQRRVESGGGMNSTPYIPTPMPQAANPPEPAQAVEVATAALKTGQDTVIIPGRQRAPIEPEKKALAWLTIMDGPKAGTRLAIQSRECTIGSASDCDIILADATVALFHAKIRKIKKSWTVHDLLTETGTFVNHQKVEEKELMGGELIILGQTILQFSLK